MWPDPAGLPELRAEVAGYLRRARGLAVTDGEVLITRGVASGLALLAAARVGRGDRVGVEEPGYQSARRVLTRAGAIVVPCPVDSRGIVPGRLPGDLKLLYTTPAHQYPLGGRLPVARRQELIAWAHATGALIVEDDYDSEYRYDVAPLPTMRGMDPGVVIYLGTTSKTLTPALGGGWLIGPPTLVTELAAIRRDLGDRVPEPVQHAVVSLLRTGDLERHVRKMRLEYGRRRAAVVETLNGARLLGDTAGMHLVVELPDIAASERVRVGAERRGVIVGTLDRYFAGPATRHGLVIGYGAASLPRIREAVATVGDVLLSAG
jgi:GntR family transcriptional regulator/MocR family aminotransferase